MKSKFQFLLQANTILIITFKTTFAPHILREGGREYEKKKEGRRESKETECVGSKRKKERKKEREKEMYKNLKKTDISPKSC